MHVQYCILNSHTHKHTSKHTTWHQSSQNPNMHLTICHLIFHPRQQHIYIKSRQKHRHGEIKQTCDRHPNIKTYQWTKTCSYPSPKYKINACSCECMFMWMHALPHLPHCITALMHQFMVISYACSWQSNKMKETPNLACEGQTNTQTEKQRLININPNKAKAWRETKKHKQKGVELGFLGLSTRTHT